MKITLQGFFVFIFFQISFGLGFTNAAAQVLDINTQKRILQAQEYIRLKQYEKAEAYLIGSISKVTNKEAIWIELGDLYIMTQQYESAAVFYQHALDLKPSNIEKYGLLAAHAYILSGNYYTAELIFEKIVQKKDWTDQKKYEYTRLKTLVEGKDLREQNKDKQVIIANLGPAINDQFAESYPSLSPSDSMLIFTKRTAGVDEDFYIAYKDPCMEVWYQAENMGYPPNTTKNESAHVISYDQHYKLIMRCEMPSDNGRAEGGCDLFLSYKTADGWSGGESFTELINTSSFEGMPSLSADNKTLYFVSNRAGGYGGMDIWKSSFHEGKWQPAENLGPTINTAGDEIAPFIASDNKTLYFSSDRHPGLGGQDFFRTQINTSNQWSQPKNLGYPYNTQFDEISFITTLNGQHCYFSSNRPGGFGDLDLYKANLLMEYQPKLMNFVYGFVIDSFDNTPVMRAKVEVYDAKGHFLSDVYTNNGDGSFFIAIPANSTHVFRYSKWNYPAMEQAVYMNYSQQHPPIPLTLRAIDWEMYKRLNLQTLDQQRDIDINEENFDTDETQSYPPPPIVEDIEESIENKEATVEGKEDELDVLRHMHSEVKELENEKTLDNKLDESKSVDHLLNQYRSQQKEAEIPYLDKKND